MHGTIVGVLRGGPSLEHEVSLRTGHAITTALPPERFTVRDIYIDRNGAWFERGREIPPERVLQSIDLALIGLHGAYGEDGEVQKLLERHGVRYAGSDSFSSYLAHHKLMAKEKAREVGLQVPNFRFLQSTDDIENAVTEITRTLHQPVFVKPVRWGSSIGVSLVGGYAPVLGAVQSLFENGADGVLVEERIVGTEAMVGIIEDFRSEELYALPPVELIPSAEVGYLSAETRYTDDTKQFAPGGFARKLGEELMNAARKMHEVLGLRHYSRSDFIVSPQGVYYLETDTLPPLGPERSFTRATDSVGLSFPDFLTHLVTRALH